MLSTIKLPYKFLNYCWGFAIRHEKKHYNTILIGKKSNEKIWLMPKLNVSKSMLINKDDANETTFTLGAQEFRNNSWFCTWCVVLHCLVAVSMSMLNDELRVNTGLTMVPAHLTL
jgi:hypothetical protein